MGERAKFIFRIKGEYTVNTLPMERLAQYMADLARMIGVPEKVHFVELVERSVGLVHAIEQEAVPAVEERIEGIERGTADIVYLDAYRALNKRLREDKSHAEYFAADAPAKALQFEGSLAPDPVQVNGVPQPGSIDGVIIRLGGTKDEIPVTVMSGDKPQRCVTNKPLAKELAKHLFEGELRLHGNGKWSRNEDGIWTMQRFVITNYEPLDTTNLARLIADLRAVPAEWDSVEDLWEDAKNIRGDRLH